MEHVPWITPICCANGKPVIEAFSGGSRRVVIN
jgi:hypothetical protein